MGRFALLLTAAILALAAALSTSLTAQTPAAAQPGNAQPAPSADVVLGDFGKPNPLVTFRLEDVAFVYGTSLRSRRAARFN